MRTVFNRGLSIVSHHQGEAVFKFRGAQSGRKRPTVSHRDIARLFRHYNCKSISSLRDAESRPMPQAERARHVAVMADWEDATRAADAVMIDNHGAVVERGILEKYVFNQARIDVGINNVATLFIRLKGDFLTDDYERSGLCL